jgi:membrane-associated phospholipid phosphatase
MNVAKLATAIATGAIALATSTPASAQSAPRDPSALTWDYPTFRPAEYVATGALGVAAIGAFLTLKAQDSPRWTGGILFDDAARDALRLRSPGARDAVRSASDVTAITSVVLVAAVDSLAVPLLRDRPGVAWQMLLVNAESFAASSLAATTTYDLVGRARPSYADCQKNPAFDPLCDTAPTTSFFSGHTTVAFTAAGLSCAHHAYLHLYGDATADALACGGMLTLAATTGTFRVLGDRHYATDVLTGGLVGFGLGYAAPVLLHYAQRDDAVARLAITPTPGGLGLSLGGSF